MFLSSTCSSHAFPEKNMMLIASSIGLSKKCSKSMIARLKLPLPFKYASIDSMRTRSRAFHCHGGCTSTSIRLPTLGSFFHKLWWRIQQRGHATSSFVVMAFLFGGGGALFLRHSGTASPLLAFSWAPTGVVLPPCLLSFSWIVRTPAPRCRDALW